MRSLNGVGHRSWLQARPCHGKRPDSIFLPAHAENNRQGLPRKSRNLDGRGVMSRIEIAPEVLDDFDRILDHIARFDVGSASERIAEILQTVQILVNNPLIGRPVRGGKRELVIGRNSRGYVALYRYLPKIDTVFLLAVRSQREAGYKR